MERISREEFTQRYGQKATSSLKHPTKRPGVFERMDDIIQRRGQQVNQAISGTGQYEDRTPVRRGFEATAQAFGAVPEVAFQVAPEPVRNVAAEAGKIVGKGFSALTGAIGDIPALQKWVMENPEAARQLEEVAGTASAAGQIAGTILTVDQGTKALQAGVNQAQKLGEKTIHATERLMETAPDRVRPAVDGVTRRFQPKKDIRGAAQEIIKGKSQQDIDDAIQAMQSIKTEGIKTFDDLQKSLDDAIPEYAKVVDDALAADPTKTQLDDLISYHELSSGSTRATNYVKTSLEHLKELYNKTGDVRMAGELDDLIYRANTEGLTKLDINNISRLYNREFGSKAFSKVSGDPLTSVNAQMYETIRKGLKDKAREGIGGQAAAQADDVMHSIYNTQRLVEKNAQAALKFQARIAERGLLEKIGHGVSTYADMLTGGTLRGFVGGLLPRGKGYKMMNILDIEQRLADNLAIIQKGLDAGDDAAIVAAANELSKSAPAPSQ